MKKPFILTIVIMLALFAKAQTYTVVKVVGSVESPALHRGLQVGDKITDKDKLKFSGSTAYVVITSPKTGNKKITGVPDASPREFVKLLESFVKPDKPTTASRGFADDGAEAIRMSMADDTVLVLGEGKIPVIDYKLSLETPAVVKVLYTSQKEKVQRVISTSKDFCLSEKCLFNGPAPAPIPKVAVFYYKADDDLPESLLGAFVPLYKDDVQLVKEVKEVIAGLSPQQHDVLVSKVADYLYQEYATVQEDNLKDWLKQKGLVK